MAEITGFTIDTANTTTDFSVIPEGRYEVLIKNAEEKQSFSGNHKLNFSFVIRNDVQQECKNRILFFEIWKKKQPNQQDIQVQGYNFNQLMNLVKNAGGIPDGTHFETVQDLCKVLVGKCLKVTVKHEEYNGKTNAKIDQFYGLEPTKFPDCKHVFKEKSAITVDSVAQRPQEQFASQATSSGSLADFEEVIPLNGISLPF